MLLGSTTLCTTFTSVSNTLNATLRGRPPLMPNAPRGAEPALADQETHCTGSAAKPLSRQGYRVPLLSLNRQLRFRFTSALNSGMGGCFTFCVINTCSTEPPHSRPGGAALDQHTDVLLCVSRSPGGSLLAGWLGTPSSAQTSPVWLQPSGELDPEPHGPEHPDSNLGFRSPRRQCHKY